MPVGDRQPLELLQNDAAWADEPRRLAEDVFGHRIRPTIYGGRWECERCGRLVVRCGTSIYGRAVKVGCPYTDVGRRYNEENGVQW